MKAGKDGWLRCDIDRNELTSLMQRSDARGLTNLAFFLVPLLVTGIAAGVATSPALTAVLLWIYASIYGFCNSLLHETHHHTAFKTRRLNETVHFLAGLMTLRNPAYDRRMHTLHHGATSSEGGDPELANPNPVSRWNLVADLFWLRAAVRQPILLFRQLFGRFTAQEGKVIPQAERALVRRHAAGIVFLYLALIAASLWYQTWLPLLYTCLAHIYGGFIPRLYALTQHVGMATSHNDYRVNTRTCYYNPVASTWYWNMNYHVEHHMFPMVPFHALPALHARLKSQMPAANASVLDAWREILSCIAYQRHKPGFSVRKRLPERDDARTLKAAGA